MLCLLLMGLCSSGCWLGTMFVHQWGVGSYEVSDILVGISCQCRVGHDKTKCVTTLIRPGRERNVRRRVRVHDWILCPASLSICLFVSGLIEQRREWRQHSQKATAVNATPIRFENCILKTSSPLLLSVRRGGVYRIPS